MRVLVLTNAYPDELRPYSGLFVWSEVEAMRRLGLDVNVQVVRGHRGTREYALGALRALALNARCPHDVVHAYYGVMGLIARAQLRVPLVVTFVGSDVQGDVDARGSPTRRGVIEPRLSRVAARLADATITVSETMARLLPRSCRARNHVVPIGVDVARFGRMSRAQARSQLGWDPDEPVVIFVADPGRHVKNFPLAVAAVERLAQRVPTVRLHAAGGVSPDAIPLWMAAADALLLTSYREGSPGVIKEAMAAELPAVATPVGDAATLFDGLPGCYLREPDPDALADGLLAALSHGRTPQAREAIISMEVTRTTERVIAVYEWALERRDRRQAVSSLHDA